MTCNYFQEGGEAPSECQPQSSDYDLAHYDVCSPWHNDNNSHQPITFSSKTLDLLIKEVLSESKN